MDQSALNGESEQSCAVVVRINLGWVYQQL